MACDNVKFVNAFRERIHVVFVQVDKSCEYLNNYAVEWNYYVAHSTAHILFLLNTSF